MSRLRLHPENHLSKFTSRISASRDAEIAVPRQHYEKVNAIVEIAPDAA
jgi:hypothetical protein